MTLNKLKESYLSVLLSIAILILNFKYNLSSHIDMEKFVDKTVDYSSISFGFLLTVLTILLQAQTKAIIAIKKADRFNDLIKANKGGVIASLALVFFSIVYLSLCDSHLLKFELTSGWSMELILNSLFLAIFVHQFVEAILFLEIFYITIKD